VDIITLDFETYYDKDFSLSKLTTEEYVRDPRFEVIGVSVKVNNGPTEWASGTKQQLHDYLHTFDWGNSFVVAQNTLFDGAILSWVFGIDAKVWADTMSMSKALDGVEVSVSLASIAKRYKLGVKGNEVIKALGMRRLDFDDDSLATYGDYCINDTDLTYAAFIRMMQLGFPRTELRLIDLTLRMFINPILEINAPLLEQHLIDVRTRKERLLAAVGVEKEDLMSNPKFAAALESLGVAIPMKISLRTGKETYAFAKTDEGFKALLTHEDVGVQALVNARLGNKSTLEETRTQRFLGIQSRGLLPIHLKYYGALTGRWSGGSKINLQNLPSRGPDAKKIKSSLCAPAGFMLIDIDSSQIEARVLAWLAGQQDVIDTFAAKEDVYKKMAASIYGVPESEVDAAQRFVGKTTILGCGYGMGAVRFQEQLGTFGVDIDLGEARRIIDVYRDANAHIKQLWRAGQNTVYALARGYGSPLGRKGVLHVVVEEQAIRLPSKLLLRYTGLTEVQIPEEDGGGTEYQYTTRRGATRIYGGKVIENVCQAIARCIIAEQMLKISKKYPIAITVHDSAVLCVPEAEVKEACAFAMECMRFVPEWAEGMPLDCEAEFGYNYGEMQSYEEE